MSDFTKKMREAFARDLADFAEGVVHPTVPESATADTSLVNAESLREHGNLAAAAGTLYRMILATSPDESLVDALIERARLDRESGQFEIAVEEFQALLECSQLHVSARIACLNNLAWLARRYFGDFDLTKRYLKGAGEHATRDGHRIRKEAAETKHQLAVLRLMQHRLSEAESLIDEVIQLREQIDGTERLDVARSLLVKGAILKAQGKLDLALKYHEETLDIREAAFGLTHADVADTLYYLGDLYKKLGRRDDAEATYRRARVAYENAASTPQGQMALVSCHSRLADAQRRKQLLAWGIVGVQSVDANAAQNASQQS